MPEITLPLDWRPRDYQKAAWEALETGTKRACLVWHRRAGKDLFAINWCASQIFQRVGLYWHILPTYNQGRKVVWEGRTRDGRAFLDHFPDGNNAGPGNVVTRKRDDTMSMWFANGSVYQVIGAEEPDRLVGANPIGIIFSEWSVMPPRVWEYLRPILAENGGWVVFIYTPRGRNHGYRTFQMASKTEGWFAEKLSVDDTQAVTLEAVDAERLAGMPEELIDQEFWCSFDAPLVGAYYGDLISSMVEQERIGVIPHEPERPVTTGWDLGVADYTSIWFHQLVGHEHRLIDYYQSSGVGLDHYAKVLSEKPYTYKEHLVPHDATVRELGTGKSRIESARKLGLNMRVVPKLPVADGINAVRFLLPKVWIDEKRCATGLEGLRQYTKERLLDEQGIDGEALFRDKPMHNWASHPADALRTLAVGLREFRKDNQILYPNIPMV